MNFKHIINSIFKSAKHEHEASKSPAAEILPLGINIGSIASFSNDLEMLLKGSSSVVVPDFHQEVGAYGKIDLGEGYCLHRFYLDDEDFWLQVTTSGYEANSVENITLFNYLSYKPISSEGELQRLAGKSSAIGLPSFEHDGKTYLRTWGSEEGLADLVELKERVKAKRESYDITHLAMLYSRETDLSNRSEFLLHSVEESAGASEGAMDVALSQSIGITLFTTDLNVI